MEAIWDMSEEYYDSSRKEDLLDKTCKSVLNFVKKFQRSVDDTDESTVY